MTKLLLGSGYVGQAFLNSPKCLKSHWIASTTSLEKIPHLSSIAKEATLLHGDEQDKMKQILSCCDGMIVCTAPQKKQSYTECYLETARCIARSLESRNTPFYLVYTSSTSVYGGPHADILLETENTYLSCQSNFVKVGILRLGGIYGPKRDLLKRAQMLSGKLLPRTGLDPTNHIHIDDIILALEFCIEKQLEGIFNLVNCEHPTKKELYSNLCKKLNIPPPSWDLTTQPIRKALSSEKLQQEGFIFKHPFFKD